MVSVLVSCVYFSSFLTAHPENNNNSFFKENVVQCVCVVINNKQQQGHGNQYQSIDTIEA